MLGPGFHGRTANHQEWMYEIVCNRHSGLDVDKVDYYARDQRRCFRDSGEIDKVMVEECVVAWGPCTGVCWKCVPGQQKRVDHLMICYPEKCVGNSFSFFQRRFRLHSDIYRHKTNEAVDFMVSDMLVRADPFLRLPVRSIPGPYDTSIAQLPMSRAMLHPGVYLNLNDSIIHLIGCSSDPNLQPSRDIYERLQNRDLFYKCVISQVLKLNRKVENLVWNNKPESEIIAELLGNPDYIHSYPDGGKVELARSDVIVQKLRMDHGQKDRDPLRRMRFLPKSEMSKVRAASIDDLPRAAVVQDDDYQARLPRTLMECRLRVFCRSPDKTKCDFLRHLFLQWWSDLTEQVAATSYQDEPPHQLTQDSGDEALSPVPSQRDVSYASSVTPLVRHGSNSARYESDEDDAF